MPPWPSLDAATPPSKVATVGARYDVIEWCIRWITLVWVFLLAFTEYGAIQVIDHARSTLTITVEVTIAQAFIAGVWGLGGAHIITRLRSVVRNGRSAELARAESEDLFLDGMNTRLSEAIEENQALRDALFRHQVVGTAEQMREDLIEQWRRRNQ